MILFIDSKFGNFDKSLIETAKTKGYKVYLSDRVVGSYPSEITQSVEAIGLKEYNSLVGYQGGYGMIVVRDSFPLLDDEDFDLYIDPLGLASRVGAQLLEPYELKYYLTREAYLLKKEGTKDYLELYDGPVLGGAVSAEGVKCSVVILNPVNFYARDVTYKFNQVNMVKELFDHTTYETNEFVLLTVEVDNKKHHSQFFDYSTIKEAWDYLESESQKHSKFEFKLTPFKSVGLTDIETFNSRKRRSANALIQGSTRPEPLTPRDMKHISDDFRVRD